MIDLQSNQAKSRWLNPRKLYVGVVAMNAQGEVGAASTLSLDNPDTYDNNRPTFPVACWRQDSNNDEPYIIEASVEGTTF